MPNNRTEKSRYTSKYGGGFISQGQYLAERMCEKIAIIEKKHLGEKFWTDKEWGKTFVFQTVQANKLLKNYSFRAIMETIKDKRCGWAKSYGANIKKILDEYEKKNVEPTEKRDIEPATISDHRPTFSPTKKSKSKLEGLD